MKLRRTGNECRPFEPELFTESATFEWLLVAISLAFGLSLGLLIQFLR